MFEHLTQGPASVSELALPLPVSLPAVLQHLAVLEAEGPVAAHDEIVPNMNCPITLGTK